jgi:aryl-alcohol dehydrogenase-like predicted oxidoreductase
MDYITLGSTGITVNKNGFGALPIQRISEDEAALLLVKAYQSGITFFDTARGYTDSEKKISLALGNVRDKIYIATKTSAGDVRTFWEHLETSLETLKTDYIDIYQFHSPQFCPKPGDGTGLYEAMLEAKAQGKIRHIGITNHRLDIAREAAESGLYETIQYPVSYLSSAEELDFVRLCAERNVGVLAMKALSGGLITDSAAAYAFLAQFDNVIPIWGVQRENELDEFIAFHDAPPMLDDRAKGVIERDIIELSGDFCRGCGYCMPCPAKILIPISARMSLLMKRAPESLFMNDNWRESMTRIDDCTECGHCKENCPYDLDAPRLLRESWAEYKKLL